MAADVLQQLHAAEVLAEQGRHARWQAAVTAWRTRRSKHALQCFCQRVTAALAEPQARLQLFAGLRASQQQAHEALVALCLRVPQLALAAGSMRAVQQWQADATAWSDGWQQQLDAHLQQLGAAEDALEQQVGGFPDGLVMLRAAVLHTGRTRLCALTTGVTAGLRCVTRVHVCCGWPAHQPRCRRSSAR